MIRRNGIPQLTVPDTATAGGHEDVACATSPDLFFAPDGPERESRRAAGRREAAAKALCASCAIRFSCLDRAMTAESGLPLPERSGIFGGMTEAERHALETGIPAQAGRPRRPGIPRPAPVARRGSPVTAGFTEDEIRMFWSRTVPGEHGPRWGLAPGGDGYGRFRSHRAGPRISAQRLAYMLYAGRDPGDDDVAQSCGDRLCLNRGCLITRPRNLHTPTGKKAAA